VISGPGAPVDVSLAAHRDLQIAGWNAAQGASAAQAA
jgi:hypothetical protein